MGYFNGINSEERKECTFIGWHGFTSGKKYKSYTLIHPKGQHERIYIINEKNEVARLDGDHFFRMLEKLFKYTRPPKRRLDGPR